MCKRTAIIEVTIKTIGGDDDIIMDDDEVKHWANRIAETNDGSEEVSLKMKLISISPTEECDEFGGGGKHSLVEVQGGGHRCVKCKQDFPPSEEQRAKQHMGMKSALIKFMRKTRVYIPDDDNVATELLMNDSPLIKQSLQFIEDNNRQLDESLKTINTFDPRIAELKRDVFFASERQKGIESNLAEAKSMLASFEKHEGEPLLVTLQTALDTIKSANNKLDTYESVSVDLEKRANANEETIKQLELVLNEKNTMIGRLQGKLSGGIVDERSIIVCFDGEDGGKAEYEELMKDKLSGDVVPKATHDAVVQELDEYKSSFELYRKASESLRRAYCLAHPEENWELTWPDGTKVNVWASEQIQKAVDANARCDRHKETADLIIKMVCETFRIPVASAGLAQALQTISDLKDFHQMNAEEAGEILGEYQENFDRLVKDLHLQVKPKEIKFFGREHSYFSPKDVIDQVLSRMKYYARSNTEMVQKYVPGWHQGLVALAFQLGWKEEDKQRGVDVITFISDMAQKGAGKG